MSFTPEPIGGLTLSSAFPTLRVTLPTGVFERLSPALAEALAVPLIVMTFGTPECSRVSVYSSVVCDTTGDYRCCFRAVQEDAVIIDARQGVQAPVHPFLIGGAPVRLFAGVPLFTADGSRAGALCVLDDHLRIFGNREEDLLRTAANLMMTELACAVLAQ